MIYDAIPIQNDVFPCSITFSSDGDGSAPKFSILLTDEDR